MSDLLERLVPPVATTDEQGRPKPSRQQRDEQLATVALGAANLVVCVVLLVLRRSLGPADMADGSKLGLLAAGCVASLATLPAARRGNRLVAGLVVLAAGFLGPATLLSVFFIAPHYGLSLWMIFRQNKLARAVADERRRERQQAGGTARTSGTRGRSSRITPTLPDGRPAPPPSKRYTPPRPKKKAPPKPEDRKPDDKKRADASAGQ